MTDPQTYTIHGMLCRVVRNGRAYTASCGALVAHGDTKASALAALTDKMEKLT